MRLIYTGEYYRRNKWLIPLMGKLTKPASYDNFFAQAAACRGHDAWDVLDRITAPTLIIGGGQDHCLGGEASRLLADKIPGAVLCMYENLGHGLYEEAGDFNARVLDFVLQ